MPLTLRERNVRARAQRRAERKQERKDARRRSGLESRQEEEREREREEARREEALREWQEVEAALDAARLEHEARLAELRAHKQAERREAERHEQKSATLLSETIASKRQKHRQQAGLADKQVKARKRILGERQTEKEQSKKEEERRIVAQKEQLADQRDSERVAEQTREQQATARLERLEEGRRVDQTGAQRDEARRARRNERRDSEQSRARHKLAQAERRDEQRETEKKQAQHESDRAARLEAQRQAQQEEERRAMALDEQQKESREAERQQARHAAALQEQRDEQHADQVEARREANRQAQLREERAATKIEDLRSTERQARQDEQRVAEKDLAKRSAARQALLEKRGTEQTKPPSSPFEDRIPSGMLSGALPWLRVKGNQIVNLDGSALLLRGISLLGLDSATPDPERGFAAGASITPAMLDAIFEWGVNVIRLAINRERVLKGSDGWNTWDYLADLDWIIQYAASHGVYTLLSLRRLDDSTLFGTIDGEPNYIAPQPDYDTIGMWRVLGERYTSEPAVLFDLYSAPHTALSDDLTGFTTDWTLWTTWIQMMVADLRRMHPRALCFVCGLDWGTDLSGFPVIGTGGDPIPNLIYAAQFFPQRANPLLSVRSLASKHPLFITEWGGYRDDIAWGEQIGRQLRAAGIGWTAAHWNGKPSLVRVAAQQSVSTPYGAIVRRELALSGDRLVGIRPGLLLPLNAY